MPKSRALWAPSPGIPSARPGCLARSTGQPQLKNSLYVDIEASKKLLPFQQSQRSGWCLDVFSPQ